MTVLESRTKAYVIHAVSNPYRHPRRKWYGFFGDETHRPYSKRNPVASFASYQEAVQKGQQRADAWDIPLINLCEEATS